LTLALHTGSITVNTTASRRLALCCEWHPGEQQDRLAVLLLGGWVIAIYVTETIAGYWVMHYDSSLVAQPGVNPHVLAGPLSRIRYAAAESAMRAADLGAAYEVMPEDMRRVAEETTGMRTPASCWLAR
jgi:hypothetical protein